MGENADNHKSVVDVPEQPKKQTSLPIGPSDFYPHDNCRCYHDQGNCDNYDEVNRGADPKGQREEKPLNHKEMKSNNSSLSKKFKDIIQKRNESEGQDKDLIAQKSASKIFPEDTKILEIIKEQNRNLERIKMYIMSTRAQTNRQCLEQPHGNQEDKLKEENSSYKNDSRSSSLEGNLESSATNEEDSFKGLFDKVNIMVTCLNDSKDLNDQIINLLKRGRDHLKHCRQSSPSSENCKELEHICGNLQFVNKENEILGHIATIGRISAGQNSTRSKKKKFCCGTIPETPPQEECCCSQHEGSNINNGKVLCLLQRMACELSDLKKKQNSVTNAIPGASLMSEIENLRERVRCLENEEPKCADNEQQAPADDAYETKQTDRQTKSRTGGSSLSKQTVEAPKSETSESSLSKQTVEAPKSETGESSLSKQTVEAPKSKTGESSLSKQKVEAPKSKTGESSLSKQKVDAPKPRTSEVGRQDRVIPNNRDQDKSKRPSFDKRNSEEESHKLRESSKLLDDDRNKLKECLKEKKMLEEKLSAAQEKLKKEQEKVAGTIKKANKDTEKLKAEIEALREQSDEVERANEDQKQEMSDLKAELIEMRKESDVTQRKVKERFERQLSAAFRKIKGLEEDLAREQAKYCNAVREKEKCCENLKCSLTRSQSKVRKLQTCIKSLIDQIRSHSITPCCTVCEKCNECND